MKSRAYWVTLFRELWSVRWAPNIRAKLKECIAALQEIKAGNTERAIFGCRVCHYCRTGEGSSCDCV